MQADMPAEVVPKLIGEDEAITMTSTPKKRESALVAGQSGKLRVCILTADFWGLKSAGGTATAYHLLAAVLAKEASLDVRLSASHLLIHNGRKLLHSS